jgi:hypothetical protein
MTAKPAWRRAVRGAGGADVAPRGAEWADAREVHG